MLHSWILERMRTGLQTLSEMPQRCTPSKATGICCVYPRLFLYRFALCGPVSDRQNIQEPNHRSRVQR